MSVEQQPVVHILLVMWIFWGPSWPGQWKKVSILLAFDHKDDAIKQAGTRAVGGPFYNLWKKRKTDDLNISYFPLRMRERDKKSLV